MIYGVAGLVSAFALAAAAWLRGGSRGGFYDREVYGMQPSAHRRYAAVSLAFVLYFAAALAMRSTQAGIAGFAVYAVIAILYGASFLQGAADRNE